MPTEHQNGVGSEANSPDPRGESGTAESSSERADGDTSQRRNRNGFYRIAHLSDIHFGSQFDPELWRYVSAMLTERHRPDAVVVTGDIVDSPWLFELGLARRELQALANRLNCKIYYVPGNHDVAVMGNLVFWPWSRYVRVVFRQKHAGVFDQLPTFTEYHSRSKSRWLSYWRWCAQFFAMRLIGLLNAGPQQETPLDVIQILPIQVRKSSDAQGPRGVKEGGDAVLFAAFNSNCRLVLATGKVDENDIHKLDMALMSLRNTRVTICLAPRIALVHHHPLPIPHSTTKESLTSIEAFLVLRNAGTLLHELGKHHFDLVLHGHKHYSAFSRLSYSVPSRPAGELAVIAAGSPTVRHDEAGRNAFNLVDIHPSGLMNHQVVSYGRGQTALSTMASEIREILPIESVKHRSYEKAVALLNSFCDCIGREVHVYESGAADFHLWVDGYRVLGGNSSGKGSLRLSVQLGAINPSGAAVDDISSIAGHYIAPPESDEPTKELKLDVNFGRDLSGRVVNHYGAVFRTINTFATSRWETEADPNLNGFDYMGVAVRHPAKRLVLKVWLPTTFHQPEAHVLCERSNGYPNLEVDDAAGEVVIGASGYTVDEDIGHFESSRLSPLGRKQGTKRDPHTEFNGWALEITEPLVGYAYLIRWRVNTAADEVTIRDKGATLELRKSLLQFRDKSPSSEIEKLRELAKGKLDDIYKLLLKPKIKSQYSQDEKIAVAVFTYDQRTNRLELVLEAGDNASLSGRVESIPLGEGVAGTAFKKRKLQMFALRELWGPEHDGGYVYYGDRKPAVDERFAVLIAIPLPLRDIEPGEEISPEETIGVLTIASTAKDSKLLSLIPEKPVSGAAPSDQSAQDTLLSFLWQTAVKYMVGVKAEIERCAALR